MNNISNTKQVKKFINDARDIYKKYCKIAEIADSKIFINKDLMCGTYCYFIDQELQFKEVGLARNSKFLSADIVNNSDNKFVWLFVTEDGQKHLISYIMGNETYIVKD